MRAAKLIMGSFLQQVAPGDEVLGGPSDRRQGDVGETGKVIL
jgi:hypothetical protein